MKRKRHLQVPCKSFTWRVVIFQNSYRSYQFFIEFIWYYFRLIVVPAYSFYSWKLILYIFTKGEFLQVIFRKTNVILFILKECSKIYGTLKCSKTTSMYIFLLSHMFSTFHNLVLLCCIKNVLSSELDGCD